MIEAENLGKRFDTRFAVQDIRFRIKPGEIVGLLGPNGAGKTTTLRMISGVLPPSTGTVTIDGRTFENDESLKGKVGFLPENNPLYDDMTVEEYLDFWCRIKSVPADRKAESVQFVTQSCGIADVYYRPIGELSKGYRQRVGLSQAILTKPDILVLDEPTEGLDPNQRHDIATLIRDLGKKRTVIISSHVLSEIARIASRLIVIHKGVIVADGSPEALRQSGGNRTSVVVEVKGDRIKSTLRSIPGVDRIAEEGPDTFVLESSKKTDVRPAVFDAAVRNKWKLLTLMRRETDIEDVFGALTSS